MPLDFGFGLLSAQMISQIPQTLKITVQSILYANQEPFVTSLDSLITLSVFICISLAAIADFSFKSPILRRPLSSFL